MMCKSIPSCKIVRKEDLDACPKLLSETSDKENANQNVDMITNGNNQGSIFGRFNRVRRAAMRSVMIAPTQ